MSATPTHDETPSATHELLRRLASASASAVPPFDDATLELVARSLRTSVVVVHRTSPGTPLHLAATYGLPAATVAHAEAYPRVDERATSAQCAATRAPVSCDAAAAEAELDRTILRYASSERVRSVPLFAFGELRGVLTFGEGRHVGDAALSGTSSALALALAARSAPHRTPSSEELLHRTLGSARSLSTFWAGGPYTFTTPEAALGERVTDSHEFFAMVAERARELVGAEIATVDVADSPDAAPVTLPPDRPDRCALTVPLRLRGQNFGTLRLANKRGGGPFDRADEAAIEVLAAVSTMLAVIERDRTRLHQILEFCPDGVVFVDEASGHILANRRFEELLGRTLQQESGLEQQRGAVFTEDGAPVPVDDLPTARALRGETTEERQLVFARPDGRRTIVSARSAPIRSSEGTILGAVSTFRDVSAHRALLATLVREEAKLRDIIEAAPDGILFLDAETGTTRVNRAFEALLGRSIEPEAGVHPEVGLVRAPDGTPLELDELPSLRALHSGEPVEQELLFAQEHGRDVPVLERAAPVRGPDNSLIGVVVSCRDLTTQKELERLREEFAAMVAHDLRNPIQSILVQVDLMRKTADEGRSVSEAVFDRLTRLGQRLGRIASDLMDSAQLDLSRVSLHVARREPTEAVRAIVDVVTPTLRTHPVHLHANGQLPDVMIDPARFEQILTNLLENAAKYSEPGSDIDVVVRGVGPFVDVAVHDRGIGISPDELPKLFDRFYQTERARQKKSGLGLGLAITKGLIEAHGGELHVESTPDRGSTFHVLLPAAPAEDRPTAAH